MKKSMIIWLFAGTFLFCSCEKDPDAPAVVTPDPAPVATCLETVSTYTKSVNFFDFRPSSPFYNQAVANFRFSQESKSYRSSNSNVYLSCPSQTCKTDLLITNNTNRRISFDFSISFNLNFVSWNYQGLVTINPGSSTVVGTVNSNCARIDLGAILLQSASITYQ